MPMVDVTNHTNAGLEMIPLLYCYFYIKDADGNVYQPTAAPIATGQLTGPILPGKKCAKRSASKCRSILKTPVLYFERGTPGQPIVAVNLTAPQ